MLPFARALAGDVQAHLITGLHRPPTPADLLGATHISHQYYEQTWSYIQTLNVVQHACRPGCAYCCYLTVEASAPEIFLIAAHLRSTLPAAHLIELQQRLRRTAEAIQGLSPEERAIAAMPCALLKENGQCQAYSVRPLGCRAWNSRDAAACAQVLVDGGGDLRPVQDQRPGGIESGVRAGFSAALGQAGLSASLLKEEDDRRCELNTGLQIALTDPTALDRWNDGEDMLAPARTAVRYSKKSAPR